MKNLQNNRKSERGSATVKLLAVVMVLVAVANAGINYIPVAYDGASFKQEMDTAIVKGLSAAGAIKPLDVVKAHIQKAAGDYNVPADAVVQVKQSGNGITAQVMYSKKVALLPFGVYDYKYDFNYMATPSGYLLKE